MVKIKKLYKTIISRLKIIIKLMFTNGGIVIFSPMEQQKKYLKGEEVNIELYYWGLNEDFRDEIVNKII